VKNQNFVAKLSIGWQKILLRKCIWPVKHGANAFIWWVKSKFESNAWPVGRFQ
jgi:hypothetical protein